MTIGMMIIPLSALIMSFDNQIGTDTILGLHPVAENVLFLRANWSFSLYNLPKARKVCTLVLVIYIRFCLIYLHLVYRTFYLTNTVPILALFHCPKLMLLLLNMLIIFLVCFCSYWVCIDHCVVNLWFNNQQDR